MVSINLIVLRTLLGYIDFVYGNWLSNRLRQNGGATTSDLKWKSFV